MGERAPGRWGPQWGVMFGDCSVRAAWNGRTQRERALEELQSVREQYASVGMGPAQRFQAYLVWRPSSEDTWRVDPVWAEEFLEA